MAKLEAARYLIEFVVRKIHFFHGFFLAFLRFVVFLLQPNHSTQTVTEVSQCAQYEDTSNRPTDVQYIQDR